MSISTTTNRPNMFTSMAAASSAVGSRNNVVSSATTKAPTMKDLIEKASSTIPATTETAATVAATPETDATVADTDMKAAAPTLNDMQAHFGAVSKPNI